MSEFDELFILLSVSQREPIPVAFLVRQFSVSPLLLLVLFPSPSKDPSKPEPEFFPAAQWLEAASKLQLLGSCRKAARLPLQMTCGPST